VNHAARHVAYDACVWCRLPMEGGRDRRARVHAASARARIMPPTPLTVVFGFSFKGKV